MRLLLVGDRPDSDAPVSTLDRNEGGFAVETVRTVDDGLERLADDRESVDCLVDARVGSGHDRFDGIEAISDRWPSLPIVFVTESATPELAAEAIATGATDCIRWSPDTGGSALLDRRIENAISSAEDVRVRELDAEPVESRRLLRALFERSPDMINVHDEVGQIVECNPRLSAKTGYDESTLTEMTVFDLDLSAEREEAREQWSGMDLGDRFRTVGEFQCRDGSTFPVEVHVRRLADNRFIAISRDITDQQERERELERKNERLDEFASVVSHDLRNPLQVLRGALDGAETTGEAAHFQRGRRAVDRMENLVNDILVMARQGDTAEDTTVTAIRAATEESWDHVETDTATLVVDTDQRIEVNETRFKQLLENLLRNAIEHSSTSHDSQARRDADEHSPEDITVTIGPLEDGFFLADDGPGIPEQERENVFESGYSTMTGGTGFGLAIVKRIAEAHGWRVDLTESENGGARFEFTGVEMG